MKNVRFIPGEHDAALDNGRAYKEFFGATNYTFEHKGVHFIVLDNVSPSLSPGTTTPNGINNLVRCGGMYGTTFV